MVCLRTLAAGQRGRCAQECAPLSAAALPATCSGPIYSPWKPSRRSRRRALTCSSGNTTGGASGGGGNALPPDSAGVLGWASTSFREAADSNLTKACLLLALEEEAAAQAAYAGAEGLGPDAARLGSVGSAGTWSLERIDSLAEEAARAFYIKLQELGVTEGVAAASRADASDSTLLAFHLDLVRSYPTQLIMAINHVVFERHGYRRQRRHGDPLDSRLSNVLENGNGSPGSLAVLYLELCDRMGLALKPVALEGGRYFVLLPADDSVSLSVAGERFVIDPFSEGLLMSEAEICELFEVGEGGLQPCSNAVMLAGILAVLRDSHWCAAVGCPPEPLLMVPISVEVALGEYRDVEVSTSSGEDEGGVPTFRVSFNEPPAEAEVPSGRQWWPAEGYHLQRALAAAQKRAWLLPDDLHALLDYALCLYFSKQYEDAWQELGCVLQAAKGEPPEAATFGEREVEQMELLWEKVRLQLAFAST